MIYVDSSVVVALLVNEPHSAAVARWYARTKSDLRVRSMVRTRICERAGHQAAHRATRCTPSASHLGAL